MEYVIALALYLGGLFLLVHALAIIFPWAGVTDRDKQGIIAGVGGMIYGFLFAWGAVSYLGI